MKLHTIQKVGERGQITIPIAWRKKSNVSYVAVSETEHGLLIKPAQIESIGEYTVFDAIRDNGGKGIKAKDLKTILKRLSK